MFGSRDCYSTPAEIHRAARARGMDVVTITDHNSIDGCLEWLARHPDSPDFLIGEEIECRVAGTALRVHLGAFGITESLHRDVQPLRGDVREAAGFLRSHGVALVWHHPFHFFRGEMPVRRYLDQLLPLVHGVEVRNGTMLPAHNALAEWAAARWAAEGSAAPFGGTGGSDAHVLCHVGDTYTIVGDDRESVSRSSAHPAVAPKDVFLSALRAGATRAGGRHATTARFAVEIYGVVFNYWGGLLGLRRSGLDPAARATGLACSVASLPFQFAPFLVSLVQKMGERRRVARWRQQLTPGGRGARGGDRGRGTAAARRSER